MTRKSRFVPQPLVTEVSSYSNGYNILDNKSASNQPVDHLQRGEECFLARESKGRKHAYISFRFRPFYRFRCIQTNTGLCSFQIHGHRSFEKSFRKEHLTALTNVIRMNLELIKIIQHRFVLGVNCSEVGKSPH